jgi:hypothetical protein
MERKKYSLFSKREYGRYFNRSSSSSSYARNQKHWGDLSVEFLENLHAMNEKALKNMLNHRKKSL